jgi:hypothetical protein
MTTKKIQYRGWPNCRRVANESIELIVTTDVGPRIIRCGFVGGDNMFKEYDAMMGKRGGAKWRIYGGHRLWHAPEVEPRTYYPDNKPVAVEQHKGFVRFIPPVESTTGLQKEIDVALPARGARARITHRLRNTNVWDVEFSPWALSVMAPGTRAIIPLPPRGRHPDDLLPVNTLTMWAYTDMSDPRWRWGETYITLQQDPQNAKPQKIGALVPDGWLGGWRDGQLFVKKFASPKGGAFPDMGSNVEVFTNDDMIELETLAPLVKLAPGATVEHTEHWFLYRNVADARSDREIDRHIRPLVRQSKTW